MKERLLVDEGAQGTRLDVFLAREKTRFSRSHIQKLIEGASVLVNGKATKANCKLSERDVVEIEIPEALGHPL